ncbi:Protein phosphatase 2C 2 [Apophysomyces sp. BC1034]|nr:Protein phosphatase 2C 2 [Apophysomyces sp. BC1015]KAG0179627.1 Protein phosphatase 2C 2 [Apophysomyces sp. BC1021]KAG0189967.1 Protein phosphatase 2C 2 [Apophysomyces sp. BC1034]
MEDAHTTIPNYEQTDTSFFAVFDGHGGSAVAKYSGDNLHAKVIQSDAFRENRYSDALRQGFLGIDEDLRKDPEYENETSGCTAVAAMLTKDNILYVSNAGDSRAVISTSGRAIAMSQDHKPVNEKEADRIWRAGGRVDYGRVNGNLALSRALGDFEYKRNKSLPAEKQAVTADPDIREHTLTGDDEFMVLACDGIWDCMTNQQVVNLIQKKLSEKKTLTTICEELMDECLADSSDVGGVGCDNMTIMIVAFLRERTTEAWYDWMSTKFVATVAVVPKDTQEECGEREPKKPRSMTEQERSPQQLVDDDSAEEKVSLN